MTRLAPIAILLLSLPASHQAPETGWCTPARCIKVVDGDTADFEIRRVVRVRFSDCWAPESRTRNPEEKQRGLASKRFVKDMLEGRQVRLLIPTDSESLKDVLTLDRFAGVIWTLDRLDVSVNERIVAAGHATREKP